jgi:hypothetical protein
VFYSFLCHNFTLNDRLERFSREAIIVGSFAGKFMAQQSGAPQFLDLRLGSLLLSKILNFARAYQLILKKCKRYQKIYNVGPEGFHTKYHLRLSCPKTQVKRV